MEIWGKGASENHPIMINDPVPKLATRHKKGTSKLGVKMKILKIHLGHTSKAFIKHDGILETNKQLISLGFYASGQLGIGMTSARGRLFKFHTSTVMCV